MKMFYIYAQKHSINDIVFCDQETRSLHFGSFCTIKIQEKGTIFDDVRKTWINMNKEDAENIFIDFNLGDKND
jgi:hypothetical protein